MFQYYTFFYKNIVFWPRLVILMKHILIKKSVALHQSTCYNLTAKKKHNQCWSLVSLNIYYFKIIPILSSFYCSTVLNFWWYFFSPYSYQKVSTSIYLFFIYLFRFANKLHVYENNKSKFTQRNETKNLYGKDTTTAFANYSGPTAKKNYKRKIRSNAAFHGVVRHLATLHLGQIDFQVRGLSSSYVLLVAE